MAPCFLNLLFIRALAEATDRKLLKRNTVKQQKKQFIKYPAAIQLTPSVAKLLGC